MEWTKEDEEVLKSYIDDLQDDNNKLKHEVFEKLIRNKYICHVLNNQELEDADAEPDDYLYENIIPYEIIHPTQVKVKNFICVLTRHQNYIAIIRLSNCNRLSLRYTASKRIIWSIQIFLIVIRLLCLLV